MTPHFCFLLVDGFSQLAFSCAIEPLRLANRVSGQELYHYSLASENGRYATCLGGIRTMVQAPFEDLPKCERVFVLSSQDMGQRASRPLLSALRRLRAGGTPIGALCSASWILARAGFLDGRSAAIHWEYHDGFKEAFPDVDLTESVFVDDLHHPTAAGGAATADFMLHLIECDHGPDLATAIADQMVYTAVRRPSAGQRVSLQSRLGTRNAHLTQAVTLMRAAIEEPVSPVHIARKVGISPRQLERLFARFLNSTPKKYFMEMRLQQAQRLLLQTEFSVTEVAVACGFENPGHFSRVYKTRYGTTPAGQRTKMG